MKGSNEGVQVEVSKVNHLCEEDSQGRRKHEVEERILRNAEARRISQLESEIENRKKDYAVLEAKFKELESQKSLVDQELKDLRESIIINPSSCIGEEESNDFLLRAEIKALECEKLKAEEDSRLFKHRCSDLGLQLLQLCGIQVSSEAVKKRNSLVSAQCSAEIPKQLTFGPGRKIAPPTPAAKPTYIRVINVADSEYNCDGNDEQVVSRGLATSKRKRVTNVVRSDSESEDDHLPIRSYLKQQHFQGPKPYLAAPDDKNGSASVQNRSVRRVVSLRQREKMRGLENSSPPIRTRARYGQGKTATYGIEDDESEEVKMDSEVESLDGFIVNDSEGDSSHSEESAGEDGGGDQLEESDDDDGNGQSADVSDSDMHEILAAISRRKSRESKWKFEAEMLADFGKDPELCMRAVCALCRLQTSDEQANKMTQHYNKQGFNQPDAYRGTTMAMFLTDGDLAGDAKKTARELEQYDPEGLEVCRHLATKYSKQLFKIYQNKEDPHFHPAD